MKKKWLNPIVAAIAVFVVGIFGYMGIQKAHTFTLANQAGTALQDEQIQPLFGTVTVSSDCDTDVVFTDVETGETHTIGYITPGVSGKVTLQKGRWYTVEGAGNLTITPVNVRIE